MSNFTEVSRLNEIMGNRKGCAVNNPNRAFSQFLLITEEMEELKAAFEYGRFADVRDAIADVLVTTYGLAHILGIDADKDMEEVQQSNLSKLCTTEAEATETIESYDRIGVKVSTRGEAPEIVIVSNCDQSDIKGKFYPAGKFLKCVNWFEPELK
jgi:NTP pyrophosphatase (non-canonical NTP hydrolase)